MRILETYNHDTAEWLNQRFRDENGNVIFGGSDAPALMGASPYTTREDLFVNKLVPPVVQPEKPAFRRGNLLEPVLVSEAANFLGIPIISPKVIYREGRFSINPDGVDNEQNPTVLVECKTTTRYSVQSSNDLPIEWQWQGWAQQLVIGAPVWFSVLDRDQRFSVVQMPTNVDAAFALTEQAEIMGRMIESGEPSPKDLNKFTAEQIAKIYKATPTSIEVPAETIDLILALEETRAARIETEKLETALRNEIARLLLNNEIGTLNGTKLVSWKEQGGRKSLDATALKRDHPELVSQYEKVGSPFRVLRTHYKEGN